MSAYRSQLDVTQPKEVQARDLMDQNRRREDALLRLLAQAGAQDGALPDAAREYLLQRAATYPTPFNDDEQGEILHEAVIPTPLDTLTDRIQTKHDQERAVAEILDMLLQYPPFSPKKEAFYQHIITALNLKKQGQPLLYAALREKLPAGKQFDKAPFDILKLLYRVLVSDEQVLALQHTSTKYRFPVGGESGKPKDVDSWVAVTSQRVCVLAAVTVDGTFYHHHETFGDDLQVRLKSGRLRDEYYFSDGEHEFRVDKSLFRSSLFKYALQGRIVSDQQPALDE